MKSIITSTIFILLFNISSTFANETSYDEVKKKLEQIRTNLGEDDAKVDNEEAYQKDILSHFQGDKGQKFVASLKAFLETSDPGKNYSSAINNAAKKIKYEGMEISAPKISICGSQEQDCNPSYPPKDNMSRQFQVAKYHMATLYALEVHKALEASTMNTKESALYAFYHGKESGAEGGQTGGEIQEREAARRKGASTTVSGETPSWLTPVIGVIGLLSLAGFVLGLLSFLQLRKQKAEAEKRAEDEAERKKNESPKKVDYSSEIASLNRSNSSMSNEIADLRRRLVNMENRNQSQRNTPAVSNPTSSKQAPPKKVFYSGTPGNGVFTQRSLEKNMNPNKHTYVIHVINDNTAEYTLNDNPVILKKAFNVPNSYITPGFELRKNPSYAKYSIVKKGKLAKDGENWRITQKGIIQG